MGKIEQSTSRVSGPPKNPDFRDDLRKRLENAKTPYNKVKAATVLCLSYCCFCTKDLNKLKGRVKCIKYTAKAAAITTSCLLCLCTLGTSLFWERESRSSVAPELASIIPPQASGTSRTPQSFLSPPPRQEMKEDSQ